MKQVSIMISAIAALIGTPALAADLPVYTKAPAFVEPVYNWSGFYGGIYGGESFRNNDITGVSPTSPDPAYNNLANGGFGQVSNTTIPGGTNCVGLVNCNVGGLAATAILVSRPLL